MPRSATLRTLTDLTDGLTEAGLDPSRIQDRAAMLAKVAGAKRKRAEDAQMDVDEDEDDEDRMRFSPVEEGDDDGEPVMADSPTHR